MTYGEKKKSFAVPELQYDAIWTEVKFSSFFLLSFNFENVSFFWGGGGVFKAPLFVETSRTL